MTVDAEKARSIFLSAVEEHTPDKWNTFLDEACRDDVGLRRRVELLLRAHQGEDSFLDRGDADDSNVTGEWEISEQPGTIIGPYKLLQQIGEGGMGVVFMAEQTAPIHRTVALKIIKPGMDTRQVIARFEAERQALAMMDHHNIAKVFDAGTTDTGRPYFVMEMVKGAPITQYCDEQKLSPRERLELFIPVCQAVQHAHLKGIIHRDIKPSNVLVAHYDDRPVPKVIDFGVAKAIEQRLTEKTVFTEFGQVVGTPEYMSPEQTRLNQLDIDTRTDVYSLGVLLYELLTGETPFDRERLRSAAFDEILRIIREEDPPRPSAKLSTSESLPSIATNRHVEPKHLSALVHGELDWIVMKALEKDRTRRYETATSLADDVGRYMRNEPVLASPPSRIYTWRKFVHRHYAAFLIVSAVSIAVITGVVLTIILIAQSARHARQMAEAANRERQHTEANFQRALEAVDQLVSRASKKSGNATSTREFREALLQDALNFYERLSQDEKLLDDSQTDPAVRQQAARAYLQVVGIAEVLGHAAQSDEASRQAIAILEKLTNDFPNVPEYRVDLARGYGLLGYRLMRKSHHQEEFDVKRKWIATAEKLVADFPTEPSYQRNLALAHTDIAHSLRYLQRLDEAETHARKALAIRKNVAAKYPDPEEDRDGLAHAYHWLGAVLMAANKLDEAEQQFRQSLALREVILASNPNSFGARNGLAHIETYLGTVLRKQGKPQEAEQFYRLSLTKKEKLADEYPNAFVDVRGTVLGSAELASALMAQGRGDEAERLLRECIARSERLVRDFPDPANDSLGVCARRQLELGVLLYASGRRPESIPSFQQALDGLERSLAEVPDNTVRQQFLASFLVECPASEFHDAGRAKTLANQALQSAPLSAELWRISGLANYRAGDGAAAVQALEKSRGLAHGGDAQLWFNLSLANWQAGRQDDARQWYQRAARWMDEHQPKDLRLAIIRAEADELFGKQSPSASSNDTHKSAAESERPFHATAE